MSTLVQVAPNDGQGERSVVALQAVNSRIKNSVKIFMVDSLIVLFF